MKKLILLAVIVVFMLQIIGCQFSINPYPDLLAKEEGEYVVLVIDIQNHPDAEKDKLVNDAVRKIKDELRNLSVEGESSLKYVTDLDNAQKRYPKLNIEEAPAVMIFDNEEMKLRTYDLNEAVEFMQSIQR